MNPRIQVLGRVRAWLGDDEVDLGSSRQKGLLALLALAGGRPLSRGHLTEALWGEHPPARHANVIQVYVTRLRRAFEPDRPARRPSEILPAVGDGYALMAGEDAVDALRLRRALAQAATARRDNEHAKVRALLEPVLGEWQSPLQDAEFFADQQTATALVEERWTAVVWHAWAAVELGEAAEVLAALEEAAAARPWDEAAQALLVRALHSVGRKAEAINVYRRVQQALKDHLGVGPGPELAEAYARLLSEPVPAEPVLSAQVVLAQLPARAGHFTGRAAELAEVKAILSAPADRAPIVCLEGGPGVGKTSLAIEAAHAVAAQYGDGQIFLDLRGHDAAAAAGRHEALVHLLRSLGADESRLPSRVDELTASYRTAISGRRLLVVLDNALGTEQILALLPPTPSCAAIVTSRHSLTALSTHHRTRRLDVGLLPPADALALLHRVVGERRVSAEPEAACELVRLCGGLPLALRIAAAKLVADRGRALASMVAELAAEHQRLDSLAVEGEARSVRGAFAWSYGGLSKPEARAFRLLSLHPGTTFNTEAVSAITEHTAEAAARVTEALAAAHLIDAAGPGRYRFHDLIRLYASELASEDPREQARWRLFDWYVEIAAGASRIVIPSHNVITRPPGVRPLPFRPEPLPALDYLGGEAGNFPLVVRDAVATGHHTEAWHLACYLFSFYIRRTRPADFLECSRWGLHAAQRTGDRRAEAVMLNIAGIAANLAHRMRESVGMHERQIAIWRELGDRARESAAWTNLGISYSWLNLHSESLEAYQRALDLSHAVGDKSRIGVTLDNIGNKARDLGDLELSEDSLNQALVIWRESGDTHGEGQALDELGKTKLLSGDPAAALDILRRALELQRASGDDRMAALSLLWIGKSRVAAGESGEAMAALRDALEAFRGMHDEHGESAVLTVMANVHTGSGGYPQAYEHLKRARELRDRVPDPLEEGLLHDAISLLASHMGDSRRAAAHRAQAGRKLREAGCYEARLTIASHEFTLGP